LGSGDYILSQRFFGNIASLDKDLVEFREDIAKHYISIDENTVRVGYIPSVIKHYYHGSKINRKYIQLNQILVNIHYDPSIHISYNSDGLIVPSAQMPIETVQEIREYFFSVMMTNIIS
jgi:hypothetical protein